MSRSVAITVKFNQCRAGAKTVDNRDLNASAASISLVKILLKLAHGIVEAFAAQVDLLRLNGNIMKT